MPDVVRTVSDFRNACEDVRQRGLRLGLVPTMGALHAGHVALIQEARRLSDRVCVSIFVNPIQFGPTEDFQKYPRDLQRDCRVCGEAGASFVFAPDPEEIYPPGECTRVSVLKLTDGLCGASRPGHFTGVATIVTKLFVGSGRCLAVFGRKDYQQLKVVERMVMDLLLPVEVVGHPIVRDSDGLALSSRNDYLSGEERARALAIPRGLSKAVRNFRGMDAGSIRKLVSAELRAADLKIDYVSVASADDLRVFSDEEALGQRTLLAVAAICGTTRLIDNVVLGEDPAPLGEAQ